MVRLSRALRPLGVPVDVVVVSRAYAQRWGDVEGTVVHSARHYRRVLPAPAPVVR